jgi:hypothetical protein
MIVTIAGRTHHVAPGRIGAARTGAHRGAAAASLQHALLPPLPHRRLLARDPIAAYEPALERREVGHAGMAVSQGRA